MSQVRARRLLSAALSASALAGACCSIAFAAAPKTAAQGDPRLNGFWNVDADFRYYAEQKIAPAQLTPAGQEVVKRNAAAQAERLKRGEAAGLQSFTCGKIGVPFITGTSEPWLLTITKDEVVQLAERRQMPTRHVYMDGRDWSETANLPPSVNGYSLGHWEGKDLVIETRHLPSGGITGRGLKGPNTVLIERAHVSDDGKHLMWTYTWTDPDLLAKPVVYELKYDRAPPHTFAYTHDCDPNEDAGRLIEAPKQD